MTLSGCFSGKEKHSALPSVFAQLVLHSRAAPGPSREKQRERWGPFDSIYFMQPWGKDDLGGQYEKGVRKPELRSVSRFGNSFVSITNTLLNASLCAQHTVRPNITETSEFGAEKGL